MWEECRKSEIQFEVSYGPGKVSCSEEHHKDNIIVGDDDDDQIVLALMKVLENPNTWPYHDIIVGSFSTEAAKVGFAAVHGMSTLVEKIAEEKGNGGGQRNVMLCCDLLECTLWKILKSLKYQKR